MSNEVRYRTLFIYNVIPEDPTKFFIVDGDHRRFDGVYINSTENEELQEELSNFLHAEDGESPRFQMTEKVPIDEIIMSHLSGYVVVQACCGFYG